MLLLIGVDKMAWFDMWRWFIDGHVVAHFWSWRGSLVDNVIWDGLLVEIVWLIGGDRTPHTEGGDIQF